MTRAHERPEPGRPNFKLTGIKGPFLALLFVYVCFVLAVLEWACRTLPISHGYQTVPQGDLSRGPAVIVSAPLFGQRKAPATPTAVFPVATQAPRRRAPSPGGRAAQIPRRRAPHSLGRNFRRYDNTTANFRDPIEVDGRLVWAPEWLDIVAPMNQSWPKNVSSSQYVRDFLQLNTTTSGQSTNLTRRRLDESAYGKVQYRPAWLELMLMIEMAHEGGVDIPILYGVYFTWYRPSLALHPEREGCIPRVEVTASDQAVYGGTSAQGLVICTGKDFAFLDNACYERWVQVIDKGTQWTQKQGIDTVLYMDMISRWDILGLGELDGDEPGRCDVALLGCSPYEDPEGCAGRQGVFEPSRAAPVLETITMRNEVGAVTAVVTAEVYHQTDIAGNTVGTRTRLRPTDASHEVDQVYQLIPLTDSTGKTTAYSTKWLNFQTTMTLRDANGSPTATITPALPLRTAVVTTLTDSNGVPTATITHRPSGTPFSPFSPPPDGNAAFHIATPQEYWAVSFLPVFFAVLASIMVDSVSASLYALMPLKELTRPAGVGAKTLLSTSGTFPFVHGVDLLYRHGEPIRLLADLLVLFTAVITALSSEAVGIKLGGSCREDDARGCYMGVAIFSIPARVVEGFLCANIVLVLCLFLLLRRWESGATMAPGSVVSIGALMQDRELRKVLRDIHVDDGTGRVSDREVIRRLDRHRYFLGYNFAWGSKDYGIVAQRIKTRVLTPERSGTWVARAATTISTAGGRLRTRTPNWITKGRVIFYAGLLYISGLLILVTYYENTILPDTAFEQFMNNQDFGVRVLFTAFGILLTFFWDYYYSWVSLREPYRRLWHSAPSHVLTTPRPTSPFTGFFGSLARREWFVSLVAFTNILSKFLPILLSTIPFSPFQTWEMHEGCTWTTIGTLGFMVLVLLWGHFAVRYPHFPVDPEGLVGQMYYLCDSEVVDNLRSAGWDSKEDILKRFGHRKYRFGEMVGSSGRVRMGVDYVRGKGEKGPEKGGAA